MKIRNHSIKVTLIILLLTFICTVMRTNDSHASVLQRETLPGNEEQSYERWGEEETAYSISGNYRYSPYYDRDSRKKLHYLAGLCPAGENQLFSFVPDTASAACHYGLDGHILYTENDWISEEGVEHVRFIRVADGEQQVIWQAERTSAAKMNYICGSLDGRYHYIMIMERNPEGKIGFSYYRYDDWNAEFQKLDTLPEKPLGFAGAAVSPNGYYFVLGSITEEDTGRLAVYSLDGKEDAVYDFDAQVNYVNLCCDNQGNILFLNRESGETGVIHHSTGEYTKLDLCMNDCIANMDCNQFILSDGQGIWFYRFDAEAPVYVCDGEYAVLMTPDAMKHDVMRAVMSNISSFRNVTYYIHGFNGMCFCTPDGAIYRIDDFDQGEISSLASCKGMEVYDAFYWSIGKARDQDLFYYYHVKDDLSQILFLNQEGMHLLDVESGVVDTLYKNQGKYLFMFVNQDFSRAIVFQDNAGRFLIDLNSRDVIEKKQDLEELKAVYSVTTDCFDGIAFAENGQLMLMDYEGNIHQVNTSFIQCDFLGIENFAEESLLYTVEVNGSRIWCTQIDEMTLCVYRLNDQLQFEEMVVKGQISAIR